MITLDEELFAAWQEGGARGQGFKLLDDNRLLITDPDGAILDGIGLVREGRARLELYRTQDTPTRKFHVEATQLLSPSGRPPTVIGGVTWELEAVDVAPAVELR